MWLSPPRPPGTGRGHPMMAWKNSTPAPKSAPAARAARIPRLAASTGRAAWSGDSRWADIPSTPLTPRRSSRSEGAGAGAGGVRGDRAAGLPVPRGRRRAAAQRRLPRPPRGQAPLSTIISGPVIGVGWLGVSIRWPPCHLMQVIQRRSRLGRGVQVFGRPSLAGQGRCGQGDEEPGRQMCAKPTWGPVTLPLQAS